MKASATSPQRPVRPLGVAIYLGIADAARDWLIGFLQTRAPTRLGPALATVERMQIALGEIDALRTTAATLLLATAQRNLTPQESVLANMSSRNARSRSCKGGCACWKFGSYPRSSPRAAFCVSPVRARVHSPHGDSVLKAAGMAALDPNVGLIPEHHAR